MSPGSGRGVGSLRIAQVAPPLEAVPPIGYGGTERIVGELVHELDRRGHLVTTFASGDSAVPGEHVETVPLALRPIGFGDDPTASFRATLELVLERQDAFDLIHAHLDRWNIELARRARIPVVSTFHGRLDQSWARDAFRDRLPGLVAISHDQARVHPEADWTVIHHGVTFRPPPLPSTAGDDFCFVGRMSPEKGFPDAIEIARLTGRRLLVAAKTPSRQVEVDYHEAVIRPLLDRADVDHPGRAGRGASATGWSPAAAPRSCRPPGRSRSGWSSSRRSPAERRSWRVGPGRSPRSSATGSTGSSATMPSSSRSSTIASAASIERRSRRRPWSGSRWGGWSTGTRRSTGDCWGADAGVATARQAVERHANRHNLHPGTVRAGLGPGSTPDGHPGGRGHARIWANPVRWAAESGNPGPASALRVRGWQ